MSILDRILRAGEGKKIKALEAIVPDINALGDEMRRLSDLVRLARQSGLAPTSAG